ncbi:stage II sporulation protein M [Litorimonas sp. RW-G-Af-16]|uniref:stage II sporulation protein M n=1 Tax=Litorimonas sp. RW-G-Af-16 TaxID=3241168 RepID=UPI00390C8AC8
MSSNLLSLQLKSQRFREERQQVWKELESLLLKIEGGRTNRLTDDEMLRLPRLYRATLSSLSVARATSLDQSVIAYLESLCTRAYYKLYGSQMGIGKRITRFFTHDFPRAAKLLWKDTIASAAFLLLGAVVAYFMVINNPDWFYSFVSADLAGSRTPAASTESLRATLYDQQDADGLGVFATFLFSHNSRVAIFAFALGFAFCIPTIILMLMTGLMLGGFIGLFASKGLGWELGGWLIIHGSTEIFAIILAGAGGIFIGRAVAFPGDRSRTDSAAYAGQTAGLLIAGVVFMLLIAGLLEGFARQLINSDVLRYGIGITLFILWCIYLYLPRDDTPLDDMFGDAL